MGEILRLMTTKAHVDEETLLRQHKSYLYNIDEHNGNQKPFSFIKCYISTEDVIAHNNKDG